MSASITTRRDGLVPEKTMSFLLTDFIVTTESLIDKIKLPSNFPMNPLPIDEVRIPVSIKVALSLSFAANWQLFCVDITCTFVSFNDRARIILNQ